MNLPPIIALSKNGSFIKNFSLEKEMILGRDGNCDIHLDDRAVSRQHAIIQMKSEGLQIEKKSEFGSLFVNGQECTTAVLKKGDKVFIGPYLVEVSEIPHQKNSNSSEDTPTLQPEQSSSQQQGTQIDFQVMKNEKDDKQNLSPEDEQKNNNEENHSFDSPNEIPLNLDFNSNENSNLESAQQPQADVFLENALEPEQEKFVESVDENEKTKVVSSSKISCKLIFKQGEANVTQYEITKDEIFLGRGKACDVILNDKKASRKNTRISRDGMRFIIQDLESSNGTFVNGEKINQKELENDDKIRIGNVEFQFNALSADYIVQEKNFLSLPEESIAADFENLVGELDKSTEAPSYVTNESIHSFSTPASSSLDVQSEGIPGITGIGAQSASKSVLIDKIKALPKPAQIALGIVAAGLFYFLYSYDPDSDSSNKPGINKKNQTEKKDIAGKKLFEELTSEQKKFVENQHILARDYFKNGDYGKAIFEISKIFPLVDDYLDSKEIMTYAKEGKRRSEALEEEKRLKLDLEKVKIRVDELIQETEAAMNKKDFEQAKSLFSQVMTLDPDNVKVAQWKKQVEQFEEQKKINEQQSLMREEINQQAWRVYKEALSFKKIGKLHSAIQTFQKTIEIGASDPKIIPLSKQMIQACHSIIRSKRDPVLAQAHEAESSGNLPSAYKLYEKATQIDPPHSVGHAGMNRIRNVLHEQVKIIYTEAVLSESYSDFEHAKKLYQQCLEIAPKEDIYHDRCERKKSLYYQSNITTPGQ